MRLRRPDEQCVRGREPRNGPKPTDAASVLDPATSPPRRPVTLGPGEGRATLPPGSSPPQNRSWHSTAEKVHPASRERLPGTGSRQGIPGSRRAASGRAEFPASTLRIHPFDSMRFHVLLNSLFKVLFNFPSRYLSAIGLVPVFSLRWSLPPALGCIPKQPDSEGARGHRVSRRKGLTPALGKATIRKT